MDLHLINLIIPSFPVQFSSTLQPNPVFLEVTFASDFSFTKHVSSLNFKYFPRFKAKGCISASFKKYLYLCVKLFFGLFWPRFYPDGFLFAFHLCFTNSTRWNVFIEPPVAPSSAAFRPLLFLFFFKLLSLVYQLPLLIFPCPIMSESFVFHSVSVF